LEYKTTISIIWYYLTTPLSTVIRIIRYVYSLETGSPAGNINYRASLLLFIALFLPLFPTLLGKIIKYLLEQNPPEFFTTVYYTNIVIFSFISLSCVFIVGFLDKK